MKNQHKLFCEFHVNGDKDGKQLNISEAVVLAGYSPNGASVTGARLLENALCLAYIGELQDARAKRTNITGDMVLRRLWNLAGGNLMDYVQVDDEGEAFIDLSTMTREQAYCVSELTSTENKKTGEIKTKIKLVDVVQPLQLVGKELGMFKDRSINENRTQPVPAKPISPEEAEMFAKKFDAKY